MENRALLAFALSLAILVGYQVLFPPVEPVSAPPVAGEAAPVRSADPVDPVAAAEAVEPAPVAPAAALERPVDVEEATLEVTTRRFRMVLTSFGGRIKSFELLDFKREAAAGSPPLDMVQTASLLPLGLTWVAADGRVIDDRNVVYSLQGEAGDVEPSQLRTIVLEGTGPGAEKLHKEITVAGDSYVLSTEFRIDGRTHPQIGVSWARSVNSVHHGYYDIDGPVAYIDKDLHGLQASSIEEPEVFKGLLSWAGYADHYFLAAFYPDQPQRLRFAATADASLGQATLWNDDAGDAVAYSLYVGPKNIHQLEELGLGAAVDLGWFTFVARPLFEVLAWIHAVVGNWGVAIILLTVLIRIVLHPVNKKQMDSMKAMQRIQPEMQKLQERYKDDRERLNKEMIELYRRHKVNPLGGCLPLLVQFPVFIGLYNVLSQAIELRQAPFFGWIVDLSQPDRLGAIAIPFVEPAGIPVLTLLMGASMLIQQRMQPSTMDPQQQRVMMLMPVVFTVMFVNFASGLVLYWFANNMMSIGQQYLANRQSA